jgi:hypothetical protein
VRPAIVPQEKSACAAAGSAGRGRSGADRIAASQRRGPVFHAAYADLAKVPADSAKITQALAAEYADALASIFARGRAPARSAA